jgi:hypothetical protein
MLLCIQRLAFKGFQKQHFHLLVNLARNVKKESRNFEKAEETLSYKESQDCQTFPDESLTALIEIEAAKLRTYLERLKSQVHPNDHSPGLSSIIKYVAQKAGVDPKTIKNWITKDFVRGQQSNVISVEQQLRLQEGESICRNVRKLEYVPSTKKTMVQTRDVSGVWSFCGVDVQAPPEFTMKEPAKTMKGTLTVRLEDNQFFGDGFDHDNDPVSLRGELLGEGSFVRGTYEVLNPRLLIAGVFLFQVKPCAKRMVGVCVQRETGQETPNNMILIETHLTFVSALPSSV